jgi:hypothetical protein
MKSDTVVEFALSRTMSSRHDGSSPGLGGACMYRSRLSMS